MLLLFLLQADFGNSADQWKIDVFLLQHVPVLKKYNTWQESKVLTLEGLKYNTLLNISIHSHLFALSYCSEFTVL